MALMFASTYRETLSQDRAYGLEGLSMERQKGRGGAQVVDDIVWCLFGRCVEIPRCVASQKLPPHLPGLRVSFYSTSQFITCCTPAHYCALLLSDLFNMLSLRWMARDTPSSPKPDQTLPEDKTNVNDCLPCRVMGILLRSFSILVSIRVA